MKAPIFDTTWNGTIGHGVGDDHFTEEVNGHLFKNLYIKEEYIFPDYVWQASETNFKAGN